MDEPNRMCAWCNRAPKQVEPLLGGLICNSCIPLVLAEIEDRLKPQRQRVRGGRLQPGDVAE